MISWVFTFIALYGTWLNAQQDKRCFWYWIASNAGFVAINWDLGQYSLVALFSAYLVMAIKGIMTWD